MQGPAGASGRRPGLRITLVVLQVFLALNALVAGFLLIPWIVAQFFWLPLPTECPNNGLT